MKTFRVVVNGSEYRVGIEELGEETGNPPPAIPKSDPAVPAITRAMPSQIQAAASSPGGEGGGGAVRAPLPGTVLRVLVSRGQQVKIGQPLLVLEAMKMENEILAQGGGTVAEIPVAPGQSVNTGDLLVVLTS